MAGGCPLPVEFMYGASVSTNSGVTYRMGINADANTGAPQSQA